MMRWSVLSSALLLGGTLLATVGVANTTWWEGTEQSGLGLQSSESTLWERGADVSWAESCTGSAGAAGAEAVTCASVAAVRWLAVLTAVLAAAAGICASLAEWTLAAIGLSSLGSSCGLCAAAVAVAVDVPGAHPSGLGLAAHCCGVVLVSFGAGAALHARRSPARSPEEQLELSTNYGASVATLERAAAGAAEDRAAVAKAVHTLLKKEVRIGVRAVPLKGDATAAKRAAQAAGPGGAPPIIPEAAPEVRL